MTEKIPDALTTDQMIAILSARGYVVVERDQFDRLCDLHTAFAQKYREILGMDPLVTQGRSRQRKNGK